MNSLLVNPSLINKLYFFFFNLLISIEKFNLRKLEAYFKKMDIGNKTALNSSKEFKIIIYNFFFFFNLTQITILSSLYDSY